MVSRVYMLPVLRLLNHPASLRIKDIRHSGMNLQADDDGVGVRARLSIGGDKTLNSIDKLCLPALPSRDRINVKDVTGALCLFRKV